VSDGERVQNLLALALKELSGNPPGHDFSAASLTRGFEAVATVGDNNTALAFDEAVAAVHEGYAQWLADREAEAAERKAELERRRAAKNDEPPF